MNTSIFLFTAISSHFYAKSIYSVMNLTEQFFSLLTSLQIYVFLESYTDIFLPLATVLEM